MNFLPEHPAILEGYRQAQSSALEAIYRAYLNSVAGLVRRGFYLSGEKPVTVIGVRDPDLQCDLIQEVFLRAFSETARTRYDGHSPFGPYILRIAKNLMIDRLRRSGREIPESALGPKDESPHLDQLGDQVQGLLEENPAEQAHFERQAQAARLWVASQDDLTRTFYELRYTKALAQETVAERLGLTRRKIRTLEAHLHKGLKQHLVAAGLWP